MADLCYHDCGQGFYVSEKPHGATYPYKTLKLQGDGSWIKPWSKNVSCPKCLKVIRVLMSREFYEKEVESGRAGPKQTVGRLF